MFSEVAIRTMQEIEKAKSTNLETIVLSAGRAIRFHRKHEYQEIHWDSDRFGSNPVDFDDFTTTFKSHLRCRKCGREIIRSVRALY